MNAYGFHSFDLSYGDAFDNPRRRPFDRFDMAIQVNVGDKKGLGRFEIRGDLWSWALGEDASGESHHAFAISHNFDYLDNEAYQFGGQGLGVGFFSKFGSARTRLTTRVRGHLIHMGAVNSDYAELADIPDPRQFRDYDFGPGAGPGLEARLTRSGRMLAEFKYDYSMIEIRTGRSTIPTPRPGGRTALIKSTEASFGC